MRPIMSVLVAGFALLLPAQSMAEELGCFGRSYTAEHLAKHPGQQVRDIRARHFRDPSGTEQLTLRIQFRDDPRDFVVPAYCEASEGSKACMVECDGGVAYPVKDQKSGNLRLTTGYLRAETNALLAGETAEGGGCSEATTRSISDLDPQGEALETVFLLRPLDAAACKQIEP